MIMILSFMACQMARCSVERTETMDFLNRDLVGSNFDKTADLEIAKSTEASVAKIVHLRDSSLQRETRLVSSYQSSSPYVKRFYQQRCFLCHDCIEFIENSG